MPPSVVLRSHLGPRASVKGILQLLLECCIILCVELVCLVMGNTDRSSEYHRSRCSELHVEFL